MHSLRTGTKTNKILRFFVEMSWQSLQCRKNEAHVTEKQSCWFSLGSEVRIDKGGGLAHMLALTPQVMTHGC